MNLSILLAEQIAVMGLMVLFGFFAGKKKLVTLEDSAAISKMVLYIICPCISLSALQTEFTQEKAMGFFLAIAATIVIHIVLLILDHFLARMLHLNNVERASIIYPNCGNLIIPIIGYMLGPDYVIYSCAFIVIQTILLWTHGFSLITENKQMNIRKIIFNPNIMAMTLGLILFFLQIRIPEIPLAAIKRTGDCIGPVSMIVVGIMLGSENLARVFTNRRSWLVSAIRLFLCPMIMVLIFSISHASNLLPEARQILFIVFLAAAAPSASSVSQMANVAHKNEIQAGSINMMTVTLCMATMPLMTLVFQTFCK